MSASPNRPALRWHGGKWLLAPWIIENLPAHRVYVEPFGGAASVLMRKPCSYAEVYNDLDGDAVNLFRVLRDADTAAALIDALRLTPFARDEFELAYEAVADPVERSRRLCIRSFMGFGSDGHNVTKKTGFRANSNRSGTTPARDWMNYPDALQAIVLRLAGVVIENREAVDVMLQHDTEETLFYIDPPYVVETRSASLPASGCYVHEMGAGAHEKLLETILGIRGMVVLSGYAHPLYDDALRGWERIERQALADGARPRTEVLWKNAAASEPTLFGAAA